MFKQFISRMSEAGVFLSSSVVIFFTFFVLVGIYLILMDADYAKEMSQKPLEN